MKIYVDANALIRLYLNLPGCDKVNAELKSAQGRRAGPIAATQLLEFEVANGIQRMVFESRNGGQWRVTPETAACAVADFSEDMDCEVFLRRSSLTLADIETEFTSLVARHTARGGFRTYDVMHVASAVTLGCKRFISFDAKANALAKLAGLKTG